MGSSRRTAAAAGIFVVGLAVGSPALAEAPSYVKVQPPKVEATSFGQPSQEATVGSTGNASTAPAARSSHSPMAFTGADIFGVTVLGLGLVGAGVAVRRLGRRQLPRPA